MPYTDPLTRAAVEAADPLTFPPSPPRSTPMADPTVTFSRGPARRPLSVASEPLLQWATGLPTAQRTSYAGWLVEQGKHEELDDAMQAAGFEAVTIKHSGGNLVTHWAVTQADVFVLCDGVQTIGEMKRTDERYGIAFGWRTLPDGRQQSQLRARVLLRPLLEVRYSSPLLLSVKSTITGDVLAALLRQYDVLDAAAQQQAASGKPAQGLPFYAFSLALAPGNEVLRGARGAQKEIVPPVADVPNPIPREYLVQHYIRREWVAGIERLVEQTVTWSVAESAAIAASELEDTSER